MVKITVGDKTFETIAEACRYYNIKESKVRNRLNLLNWSIDEAFELVPRRKKKIILEGKTFKSIAEACRYYNLDREIIYRRVNNGWTLEEAFEIVERKYKQKITIKDKVFNNLLDACRYYNTDYALLRNRIESGWNIEDALKTPVLIERKGKYIFIDNNEFISLAEACRYYNKDYIKVHSRLKIGWSLEEALEIVKKENGSYKSITVKDKTFKSVTEACKYYNLPRVNVIKRIKRGWSIEEAFELVPRKKKLKER